MLVDLDALPNLARQIGTITYSPELARSDRPVTRTVRLVVLQEIPEDANLRQQWNALVQRVDQPQVFYTYEWSLAVQRAYHAMLRPLLFLVTTSRIIVRSRVPCCRRGRAARVFSLRYDRRLLRFYRPCRSTSQPSLRQSWPN